MGDVTAVEAFADPDPEVVVHCKTKGLVQTPDRFENCSLEKCRRLADNVGCGQSVQIKFFSAIVADNPPGYINIMGITYINPASG